MHTINIYYKEPFLYAGRLLSVARGPWTIETRDSRFPCGPWPTKQEAIDAVWPIIVAGPPPPIWPSD